jgi:peptide/nickel transport system permease protein
LHSRAQRLYLGCRQLARSPLGMLGALLLLILVLTAIFAPFIAPHDPYAQDMAVRLLPPSFDHPLGTDQFGRDIMSRIAYGARTTLVIVALVSIIVAPIGLVVGATAGYVGGLLDLTLMRITDIFLALPGLVLALAFAAALGPGLENAVIAIALTVWPPMARLARAEALTIRNTDYIAAIRGQGAGALRIIVLHVMPMCLPSVIVRVTLNMAGVILTAAGLGFLGLGAQPPTPEWGAMIATGRQFMLDSWWTVTMPGLAILLISLAFNLFGDALRDVLDPRNSR